MRILVDGDACPQRQEIAKIAVKFHVPMIVFTDYAHIMENQFYEVRTCEIGKDNVDFMIINEAQTGDLVITQDYGLASLVLVKGALVLHVSGMMIDQHNIDELLMKRYMGCKNRHIHKHFRGPKKRTEETKIFFIEQFLKIVEERNR